MFWLEVAVTGGSMLAAVFGLNFLQRLLVPAIEKEYTAAGTIFRSFSDSRMLYMFVHPFVLATALLYLRTVLAPLRYSNHHIAVLLWAVGPLPGITVDYASFRISFKMAFWWYLLTLGQLYAGAQIITMRHG